MNLIRRSIKFWAASLHVDLIVSSGCVAVQTGGGVAFNIEFPQGEPANFKEGIR